MLPVNKEDYRWLIWLGLAVLILEVLVVVLRGGLPIPCVFLLVDSSGALIAALVRIGTVWTGQRKAGLAEQQSRHLSIRGGANRIHYFLENTENQAEIADLCRDHEVDQTRGDESTTTVLRHQREEAKNHEDDTEALELLRQAGFSAIESDRLCRLRKHCAKQEGDYTPVLL
jgi:hypothetical protein